MVVADACTGRTCLSFDYPLVWLLLTISPSSFSFLVLPTLFWSIPSCAFHLVPCSLQLTLFAFLHSLSLSLSPFLKNHIVFVGFGARVAREAGGASTVERG